MSTRDTEPVYTRIPLDQAEWLAEYAKRHRLTKSAALAAVVEQGIAQLNPDEPPPPRKAA